MYTEPLLCTSSSSGDPDRTKTASRGRIVFGIHPDANYFRFFDVLKLGHSNKFIVLLALTKLKKDVCKTLLQFLDDYQMV